MRKIGLAVLGSILFSSFAFGQNNRSAVSLTGNDAATCTVPDPCRTFDVAISKTNAGGEVIVLSSAGSGRSRSTSRFPSFPRPHITRRWPRHPAMRSPSMWTTRWSSSAV